MTKDNKAFSLIEIMITVVVIMILISISVGVYNRVVARTGIVYTKSLLNGIDQALLLYQDITGTYPVINNLDNQYKLYQALVPSPSTPLVIRTFDGTIVRQIKESFIDIETLNQEGMIKEDPSNPGEYLFLDPWGTPLNYFYGPVDPSCYAMAEDLVMVGPEGSEVPYNINWKNNHFDLFSYGPDFDLNSGIDKNDNIFQRK